MSIENFKDNICKLDITFSEDVTETRVDKLDKFS